MSLSKSIAGNHVMSRHGQTGWGIQYRTAASRGALVVGGRVGGRLVRPLVLLGVAARTQAHMLCLWAIISTCYSTSARTLSLHAPTEHSSDWSGTVQLKAENMSLSISTAGNHVIMYPQLATMSVQTPTASGCVIAHTHS